MNEIFEFDGQRSRLAVFFLIVAIILLVLGAIVAPGWAVFATIPLAIATIRFWARTRPERIELGETAIECQNRSISIRYAEIQGIWNGRSNLALHRMPAIAPGLSIQHSAGILDLQDRDLTKLTDFVDQLRQRVGPVKVASLNAPHVNQYWLEEKKSFDEKLILVCREAPVFVVRPGARRFSGRTALVSCLLAGILWILLAWFFSRGQAIQDEFLTGVTILHGVIFSIVGLISTAVYLLSRTRYQKSGRSALIISPRGFALAQQKLDGSLTWNEVKDIKKTRLGLVIRVAGATILIQDIYDLPMELIYQAMLANLG